MKEYDRLFPQHEEQCVSKFNHFRPSEEESPKNWAWVQRVPECKMCAINKINTEILSMGRPRFNRDTHTRVWIGKLYKDSYPTITEHKWSDASRPVRKSLGTILGMSEQSRRVKRWPVPSSRSGGVLVTWKVVENAWTSDPRGSGSRRRQKWRGWWASSAPSRFAIW